MLSVICGVYVNVNIVELSGFMRIRYLEVHISTSFKNVCSWVVASNSEVFLLNSAVSSAYRVVSWNFMCINNV